MKSVYAGKIKVVGLGSMCFPVDPETLEPVACARYDPFWQVDHFQIATISLAKWCETAEMRKQEGIK